MSELKIPADLLPADGRFGCGPAKIPTAALDSLASATIMGTSHRQEPVRKLVGELRSGLTELYHLPDGYEVVCGNGGATQFWDMASLGLINQRSAHGVFGAFSRKFAEVIARAPHLANPEVAEAPMGSVALPLPDPTVDAYAWAHNETSTGVIAGVHRIANEGLILIDGTSAAGAVVVDITQTDAYYFAPQKGFAADGGMWWALLSPAALDRCAKIAASDRWIPETLALQVAVDNSAKNQTLNTPALATLWLMGHQLRWLLELGGLTAAAERSQRSSSLLYSWAAQNPFATPLVAVPENRSPVVVTIDFDERVDARALAAALRANGVVDTEPYRALKRNHLRISTFPAIDPADVEALCGCLDWLIDNGCGQSR